MLTYHHSSVPPVPFHDDGDSDTQSRHFLQRSGMSIRPFHDGNRMRISNRLHYVSKWHLAWSDVGEYSGLQNDGDVVGCLDTPARPGPKK